MPSSCSSDYELIVGNANRRFSGVTSTMLQTLQYQRKLMPVAVLGGHHLPKGICVVTFWHLATGLRKPLPDGRWRVFHARRNNEMIQALVLKYLFRAKVRIVFTSTAQRYHTGFTRWLMSKMDAVISTCTAAASYLREPPAKLIPHGIRSELYSPAENRQQVLSELGVEGVQAIGIFGRVRPQKGVHLFVRAAIVLLPSHPGTVALIVGAITSENEEFVKQLKHEITQAGLQQRIRFLGERPFDELPKLFRAMSVVCALSRNEGFGLTVLEAMSSGVAVLATDAGAWRDIVREGLDGWVVPTEDSQAINSTLGTMLDKPEKTLAMGRQGRERVLSHYTIEREARELVMFFRSLQ